MQIYKNLRYWQLMQGHSPNENCLHQLQENCQVSVSYKQMVPGLAGLQSETNCGVKVFTIMLSTAFASSSFSLPPTLSFLWTHAKQSTTGIKNKFCTLKHVHHYFDRNYFQDGHHYGLNIC